MNRQEDISTWKSANEGFGDFDAELACDSWSDPTVADKLEDLEKKSQDYVPSPASKDIAQTLYEQSVNSDRVRACKWLHQSELEAEYTPTRIMHMATFLKLLQKIRPDAHYNEFAVAGYRGLNFRRSGDPCYGAAFFGTAIQDGYFPEFSKMRFDHYGLPLNEVYRGWRTVLLTLIDKGIIPEEKVEKVFGPPSVGPRYARWYRSLYMLRNNRCLDCGNRLCSCKTAGETSRADNYAYTPDTPATPPAAIL